MNQPMNPWQPLSLIALFWIGSLTTSIGTAQAAVPSLRFRPPSRGTPPITSGAASRNGGMGGGACIQGKEPLKALMPRSSYGLTTAPQPTLLVYVPPSSAQRLEFQLRTQDNKRRMVRKSFAVPAAGGIVRLSLEDGQMPPMQPHFPYRWYVSLLCSEGDRDLNPIVEGWIERTSVDAALKQKIAQATPQTLPYVFADAGLWYEAVDSMAALRRQQPTAADIHANWTTLLQSVGLDAYAKKASLDCCQPQPQPQRQ